MEFWAVVGESNSRKSSTIRALTGGQASGRIWDVLVGGAPAKVFVESSAPQEKPAKTPQKVVSDVSANPAATHLVIALRHRGTTLSRLDADAYISHFVSIGWTCLGILVTSDEPPPTTLARKYPHLIDYAPALVKPFSPSNQIANVVRSKWGL